ncbi:MAG: BACON domain-containing protein, partial [Alistipes sp.]|nr:BACON domain-containing protein [Alistipes sp.]
MRRFVFILLSLVGVIAVGCNNEQPSTPVIKLSHSTIDAWYDADTYIFDVYANCEWRATSDSDWAVVETGANAKGDSIVKIAVAKNDSAELRVAHIRVEAVEDAGLFEMV